MNASAPRDNRLRRSLAVYGAAIFLCLLTMTLTLNLWQADLSVPFIYNGDEIVNTMMIKGVVENDWYLSNDRIGAPFGLRLHDFPAADNFPLLLIKLLTLFTSNPSLLLNLFYLGCYPLITLSALYVYRRIGLPALPAIVGSLLFTFLPSHFLSSTNHLFLSAYFLIPPGILIAWWIATGTLLRDEGQVRDEDESPDKDHGRLRDTSATKRRTPSLRFKLIFSFATCVLLGSSGIYYPFFTCFFLVVAATIALASQRDARHALLACGFVVVIGAVLIANLTPSLLYLKRNGDVGTAQRSVRDVDFYGLKITHLLLPIRQHRAPALAEFKDTYIRTLVPEDTGDYTAMGAVASSGFLILIWWLLFKKPRAVALRRDGASGALDHFSLFNITGVLLATAGGFGTLFALLISPQVRVIQRMTLFVAFFSLAAVLLLIDRFARKFMRPHAAPLAYGGLFALLLCLGIYDQTNAHYAPDYAAVQAEYANDAGFFRRVEAAMPDGALIFQLPYSYFPGPPIVHKMRDYSHLRAYLHTNDLRWSYPAIKRREGDIWQSAVTAKPLPELVSTLALAGFSGIHVDRYAYADNGVELVANLQRLLGTTPLADARNRFAFFDMTNYVNSLRAQMTPTEWQAAQDRALHPLLVSWHGGFSELETLGDEHWRWCSASGEMQITNSSQRARRVRLRMSFNTGYEQPSTLRIGGSLITEALRLNDQRTPFERTITVPPGSHAVNFFCDAPRVVAPNDTRVLVWRLNDFSIEEID